MFELNFMWASSFCCISSLHFSNNAVVLMVGSYLSTAFTGSTLCKVDNQCHSRYLKFSSSHEKAFVYDDNGTTLQKTVRRRCKKTISTSADAFAINNEHNMAPFFTNIFHPNVENLVAAKICILAVAVISST